MRNSSIITCAMSGIRIAGELSFTPAYINQAEKLVNDRCSIPVIGNDRRGSGRDGKSGRQNNFRLVAWAGLARALAKYGSTGKALDVSTRPESYEGRVYKMAPNPANPAEMSPQVVMVGGAALTVEKIGFTIVELNFGEDSPKQIQRELQLYASNPGNIGGRPPQWNVVGSPDAALFTQILEQRKQLAWDGQSSHFGYARVVTPQTAQRILNIQERLTLATQGVAALNLPIPQAQATYTNAPANVAAAFAPTVMPVPVQVQTQTGFATGAPNTAAAVPVQAQTFTPTQLF